ncbi:TIGR01457 family HAD-type hydrolase [Paenibacillus lacisoli]
MKGLLIDLDGTIYHGKSIISGADLLIQELRRQGIPYLYVTNNASRTPASVAEHLRSLGIEADAHEVCTSALASAEYIASEISDGKVYCIGEAGLREALADKGLLLVEDEQADIVVQGIDRSFTYDKLAGAVSQILGGARFVMTNPDLLLPTDSGFIPGAGSIGASIQAATSVQPIIIGKPSGILMDYALDRMGIQADEALVIGDNMRTDIAAGVAAGCRTALVLTGVTTRENMDTHLKETGLQADWIFDSLADLRIWIEQNIGKER